MEIKKIRDYKDLIVWQKSMDLVTIIYQITILFPSEEKFGLTSQLRRSSISIPSNIAEGCQRGTSKDYVQFLRISLGSCAELETQLMVAINLAFIKSIESKNILDKTIEIKKMLSSLIVKLKPKE